MEKVAELTHEASRQCQLIAALNNLSDAATFIEAFQSVDLNIPELSRSQFQMCMKRLEERTRPFTKAAPRDCWLTLTLKQRLTLSLRLTQN